MLKLVLILFLFYTTKTYGATLEDAMNEVLNIKKEVCIPANVAVLQVIDKTEATVKTIEIKVGEVLKLDSATEVSPIKCCNNSFQANSFIKMHNIKNKKDVFLGWMFSVYTSLNSPEDPKFDLTLLKCL